MPTTFRSRKGKDGKRKSYPVDERKKGSGYNGQTKDPHWKESSVDDLGFPDPDKGKKHKKVKVKGWVVWGYRPKMIKGEKWAVDGKQLTDPTKTKRVANQQAKKLREVGYVTNVQPVFKEPRNS